MKLRDIYAQPGKTFSVEFYPPKDDAGVERLFAEIEKLKKLSAGVLLGDVRRRRLDAGHDARGRAAHPPRGAAQGRCATSRSSTSPSATSTACSTSCARTRSRTSSRWPAIRPKGQQEADWAPHPEGYHHSRELVEDALRPPAGLVLGRGRRLPGGPSARGRPRVRPALPQGEGRRRRRRRRHPALLRQRRLLPLRRGRARDRRRGADRAGDDAHPVIRPVPADRVDVRLEDPGRPRGAAGRRSRTTPTPRCSSASTTRPSSARGCSSTACPAFTSTR